MKKLVLVKLYLQDMDMHFYIFLMHFNISNLFETKFNKNFMEIN